MAELYDPSRLNDLLDASRAPSHTNLGLACKYLLQLLARNGIPTLVLGGWALHLRGSSRDTKNVDLAVQSNWKSLVAVLRRDVRLLIPQRSSQSVITIFVRTGGNEDAKIDPVQTAATVAVEIIIGGSKGIPELLGTATEMISPPPNALSLVPTPVLALHLQVIAKLDAFASHRRDKDLSDLTFLYRKYPAELYNLRLYFDLAKRKVFYQQARAAYPDATQYLDSLAINLGLVE